MGETERGEMLVALTTTDAIGPAPAWRLRGPAPARRRVVVFVYCVSLTRSVLCPFYTGRRDLCDAERDLLVIAEFLVSYC